MNTAKAIKLAKKLKELVDKGVGGEAHNAKRKLDALVQKYNLNSSEVFGTETECAWQLTTINESSAILNRVILSVKPDAKINTETQGIKLTVKVMLTEKEYKQIKKKHIFFWNAYNRERSTLLSAFFNKNSHYFIPRMKVKENFFNAGAVRQAPPKEKPHMEGEVEIMSTDDQRRVGAMMKIMRDLHFDLSEEEMNDLKMIDAAKDSNRR